MRACVRACIYAYMIYHIGLSNNYIMIVTMAVKDKDGTLLTGDDEVKDRWLGYFDDLLHVENEREDLEGILPGRDFTSLHFTSLHFTSLRLLSRGRRDDTSNNG